MKIAGKCKRLLKKVKNRIMSVLTSGAKKAQVLESNGLTGNKKARYFVRTGDWVKENSISLEGNYVRVQGADTVGSSMEKKNSLVAKMRAKDAFLEQCLRSGDYTDGKFLVVKNPYLLSPLTALVLFRTERQYRIRVEVEGEANGIVDDQDGAGNTGVSGTTELSEIHRLPIIGLYPGRENRVSLRFFDEDGRLCKTIVFSLKMKPLPDALKEMVMVKENQRQSAFGLTFVYGGDTRFPYAFDREGTIRFYIARQPKPYGLHFLSDGHFLFAEKNVLMPSFGNPHSGQILEMDLLGRVHRIYNVENGLHHDASEMTPGGNIIAAGSSLEHSNEDMVMELDRRTGKVVKQVKLGDVFDKTYQDGIDWVHLNTVSYDAETNSVLICCRNLHTVAKIDWATGKLEWILCHPKFWKGTSMEGKLLTPVGKDLKKTGWFYQAHAAYFLKEDLDGNSDTVHMIIYDNHWHKRRSVSYFDEDPNSFVRIYSINEKEHTVSLWKSFPCAKSKIRSNGVLCYERNRLFAMSGFLEPPVEGCGGMINEYDFLSGKLLNQYLTKASFYRAYELPLNYPDLAKPMEQDTEYMLGEIRKPYPAERPNLSASMPLPGRDMLYAVDQVYYKGTKAERKKKYEEAMESGEAPFDIEQDVANTGMELYENILYVNAVDHLVRKVYFVGQRNCYVQDYSDTKQTNPGLFGRMFYSVMVPLGGFAEDSYCIYLECEGKLYDTGQKIEMK